MRLFVAIDMPDHVSDALEDLQAQLPVGQPVERTTLHLTLAFLGELSRSSGEALHDALTEISTPAFDLQLRGVGCFGAKSPRLLWAGVAPCPALTHLRKRVRSVIRGAGIELPRERFRPHVTMARFRRQPEGHELEKLLGYLAHFADVQLPCLEVGHITLFESRLFPEGPVHDVLATYPLA